MTGNLRVVLNTEQTPSGQYEWVLTSIDAAVSTMPHVERSKQSYASEEEAQHAGETALAALRER